MTATHLDYDTLADLTEDLLDDDARAAAEAHLADCRVCKDRLAELAGVTRILAAARPPSMPPDLQVRLSAALAAEARVAPIHQRRSRRYQVVAAAAAAVVVVGGGTFAAVSLSGRSNLSAASGSAEATAERGAPPTTFGHADHPFVRAGDGPSASGRSYAVYDSGTAFTATGLPSQVRDAVEHLQQGATAAAAADAQLAACVARVVGSARRTLLVDEGTYQGAPASVIVAQNGVMGLDVWVVGSGCSGTTSDIITQFATSR